LAEFLPAGWNPAISPLANLRRKYNMAKVDDGTSATSSTARAIRMAVSSAPKSGAAAQ